MPLATKTGSTTSVSTPTDPIKHKHGINDKLPEINGHALTDERVVQDTFSNNTSVNTDIMRDNLSLIAAYPEGRIALVTYYSQNRPITDVNSHVVDLSMETKDNVHLSWTEIRNCELRLANEINFSYEDESNHSKVTGDAIVFPLFQPRVGDQFILEMRNGKYGIFHIGGISRLALGQDTYHKITFTMTEYLTREKRDQLKRQSTGVFYFDKTKFIIGNSAVLSSDHYAYQQELISLRKQIIHNYVDRFYNEAYSSFRRSDEMYDPYVVEYWNKKISYREGLVRPSQLFIGMRNFNKTIWSLLTNNPIKRLKNVVTNIESRTYAATFFDINITSLLGTKFITVGDESGDGSLNNRVLHQGTGYSEKYNTVIQMEIPDDVYERSLDKFFDKQRHDLYGHHLPHRQCPPHQHPKDGTLIGRVYREPEAHCPGSHPHHCADFTFDERQHYDRYPCHPHPRPHPNDHCHSECHKECGMSACPITQTESTEDIPTYGLSKEFYNGSAAMTTMEKLIYDAITGDKIDIPAVVDLANLYLDWSDEDAFYNHMFCIYLIDKALHWLLHKA